MLDISKLPKVRSSISNRQVDRNRIARVRITLGKEVMLKITNNLTMEIGRITTTDTAISTATILRNSNNSR
jgi:hypothetical protein